MQELSISVKFWQEETLVNLAKWMSFTGYQEYIILERVSYCGMAYQKWMCKVFSVIVLNLCVWLKYWCKLLNTFVK